MTLNQLFGSLSLEDRERILAEGKPQLATKGTVLMRLGELADSFVILTGGEVRVSTGESGHRQFLAELRAPTIIGETAIFAGLKRTATVTASTDIKMVVLDRTAIDRLLNASPQLRTWLAKLAMERAEQTVMTLSKQ